MTPADAHRICSFAQVELTAEQVPSVAISDDCTLWRREPYLNPVHDLACTLARPVAEMMCSHVLNPFLHPNMINDRLLSEVLAYVRENHDGSTICDSETILCYPREMIAQALPAAVQAAQTAHRNVLTRPSRHDAVLSVIERLGPKTCLVIDQEALACLRGEGTQMRLPVVSFKVWYAGVTREQDAARTQELLDKHWRVLAQMACLGQADANGNLTALGSARLDLNEANP